MKKLFLTFLILFSYIFTYSMVYAASLSLAAPTSIETGKTFEVKILVDTDGESINSVDIGISYPKNLVEFAGYKEGAGVVKIWLKHPSTDQSGRIELSGIVPGGVDGTYNPNISGLGPVVIADLLFKGKAAGSAEFGIAHSSVLLNDGHGSPLLYDSKGAQISISASSGSTEIAKSTEGDTPEPFTVQFVDSGYFSKTPPILIFSSSSTNGIEKYELKNNGDWVTVESPLAIHKGLLTKTMTIRAVGFGGNSEESSVNVPGFLSPLVVSLLLIAIIVFAYSRFLWYKKRR